MDIIARKTILALTRMTISQLLPREYPKYMSIESQIRDPRKVRRENSFQSIFPMPAGIDMKVLNIGTSLVPKTLLAYGIGYYGGKPLIVRFGKYVMMDESTVDHVQAWFHKYGPAPPAPIIRTSVFSVV